MALAYSYEEWRVDSEAASAVTLPASHTALSPVTGMPGRQRAAAGPAAHTLAQVAGGRKDEKLMLSKVIYPELVLLSGVK